MKRAVSFGVESVDAPRDQLDGEVDVADAESLPLRVGNVVHVDHKGRERRVPGKPAVVSSDTGREGIVSRVLMSCVSLPSSLGIGRETYCTLESLTMTQSGQSGAAMSDNRPARCSMVQFGVGKKTCPLSSEEERNDCSFDGPRPS